jgi:hypothetical protein
VEEKPQLSSPLPKTIRLSRQLRIHRAQFVKRRQHRNFRGQSASQQQIRTQVTIIHSITIHTHIIAQKLTVPANASNRTARRVLMTTNYSSPNAAASSWSRGRFATAQRQSACCLPKRYQLFEVDNTTKTIPDSCVKNWSWPTRLDIVPLSSPLLSNLNSRFPSIGSGAQRVLTYKPVTSPETQDRYGLTQVQFDFTLCNWHTELLKHPTKHSDYKRKI